MPTGVTCSRLGACSSPWAMPNAGSSQPTIQLFSSRPLAKEKKPRMISGTVITAGDSCGCTPANHRFWPRKVISINRVM